MSRSRKISAVIFISMALPLASCGGCHSAPSKSFPAQSLRHASSVYEKFAEKLSTEPRDNDFTKFAADPRNYKATISEDGDCFFYTFSLKDYRGRPVLDGGFTYKVYQDGEVELQNNM